MFDYDTKEREHQNTQQSDLYSGATPPRTNQIASCFGALSFTLNIIIEENLLKYMKLLTNMSNLRAEKCTA
jgi:hypothetical protein